MVRDELQGTAIKVTGGAATYAGSYIAVESSLTIAEASEIATLVAACCTALYFAMQFLYTTWKWHQEIQRLKKECHIREDD
jgi:hypothetical protein